jgi:hypothetical protein
MAAWRRAGLGLVASFALSGLIIQVRRVRMPAAAAWAGAGQHAGRRAGSRVGWVRVVQGAAPLTRKPPVQVFQSSDGVELLRGHAFERLDRAAPKSPIGYWGLGGVARPRHWAPARYSSMVHFRPHKGRVHHAKLVHFQHNAALEREAAGLPPQEDSAAVQVAAAAREAGRPLRRHMKAGLFDKEDNGAPMGTHFVTSPDHPQYVKAEEVAAPEEEEEPSAKQFARANSFESSTMKRVPVPARNGHDLSESVAPGDAMGTHFLSSPEHPAEQGAQGGGRVEEAPADQMGTHFISNPAHPEEQVAPQPRASMADADEGDSEGQVAVEDASAMGTHFLQSPDRPGQQPAAGKLVKQARRDEQVQVAAADRPAASAHVHSSDTATSEFGTHFVGSASSFSAPRRKAADEVDESSWDTQSGVLSAKDRVGDSEYVVPKEAGSEEGGVENEQNMLSPEDRVGNVEYTSDDDYASYHAGERDPDLTFGPNTVGVRGGAEAAGDPGRERPQSSDSPQMPMGTNFVASKQGKGYSKDDIIGRAKPYSSDFPLPWSGTNSVFIGSHQGGDATFSHQHGETDAAPGTINTVGRGSQRGYRPPAAPAAVPQPAPAPEMPAAAAQMPAPMPAGDRPADARMQPPMPGQPMMQPPMPAQPVAPGGVPYGLDQKAAYEAKRRQQKRDEDKMMGLPNTASSHPCTSCVPQGGPSE